MSPQRQAGCRRSHRALHRPPIVLVTALAVGALLMAGCGEREEVVEPAAPERLELVVDREPDALLAPIYAAQAGGHLAERGIEAQVRPTGAAEDPIAQVAEGQADLAVASEPEVFAARADRLPVVSVAAIVQQPLAAIVSAPPARIETVEDLRGTRVATVGPPYRAELADALLDGAGVSPAAVDRVEPPGDPAAALADGSVDALLGALRTVEATKLDLRGAPPDVIRFDKAGIPAYDELVLVASEDALAREPGLLRSLVAGLAEGLGDLRDDPEAALAPLLRSNPELDPALQRAILRETLPLFAPPPGEPYGWQEPEHWDRFGLFLREAGIVEDEVPPRLAFSNELLEAQGLED